MIQRNILTELTIVKKIFEEIHKQIEAKVLRIKGENKMLKIEKIYKK